MSDEYAKAVQEASKAVTKGLETAEGAGNWIERTFGGGFKHLGGAWEDKMLEFRINNRLNIIGRLKPKLDALGPIKMRALPDRFVVPLIDACSDEDDENIQEVWANYILNAIDPTKAPPDRGMIDIIRRLDPADCGIIQKLINAPERSVKWSDLADEKAAVSATLDRLSRLGLFLYEDGSLEYVVAKAPEDNRLIVEVDHDLYRALRLFALFAEAISLRGRA